MGKKFIIEKYWIDKDIEDKSLFSKNVKATDGKMNENVVLPLENTLHSQDCQGCEGGGYKANLKTLVSFFVGCFNPKLNRVYCINENEVLEEIENFDDVPEIDEVPIEVVIYTDVETFFYKVDTQENNIVKVIVNKTCLIYSSEDSFQGKIVNNIMIHNLKIDSRINVLKNVRDYNFAKFRKFHLKTDGTCEKYCQNVSLTLKDEQQVSVKVKTKCDEDVKFNQIKKNKFIDDVPISVKVNGHDMFTRMVSRLMVRETNTRAKSYLFYYEDEDRISFYMTGSYFYIIHKIKQQQAQGGAQPYVTILGRRRKVFKIGRSLFVKVHGADVKLSDAKKLEKKHS